jgi:hypothetical protein
MLSKKLIPIRDSSCFDASGYFGGRAAFRFHNGRVIYRTIPVQMWQRFMEAPSKGKFFRQEIKGARYVEKLQRGQMRAVTSNLPPLLKSRLIIPAAQRCQIGNRNEELTHTMHSTTPIPKDKTEPRFRLADSDDEIDAIRIFNSDLRRAYQQISYNNVSTRAADAMRALSTSPNPFLLVGQLRRLSRGIHRPNDRLFSVSLTRAFQMLTELQPTKPISQARAQVAA